MNAAHLHLLVNHASLFLLLLGVITYAFSMKRKSTELRVMATALFVAAGIAVLIAFETGESAADVINALGGGTKSFIDQHAGAAEWARRSGVFVALLAIAAEWSIRAKKKWSRFVKWALLLFAIHGCTVQAFTAYLGGQIRHTEIRNSASK